MNKLKGALLVVVLVCSGFMFQGCLSTPPGADSGVQVTVPHAQQFAQIAKQVAIISKTEFIDPEFAAQTETVLRQIISVVGGSEGKISELILKTADEAIKVGQLNPAYKLFFVGLEGVIQNYYQFGDYKVDDVLLILQGAADGLGSEVSVASVEKPGFDW